MPEVVVGKRVADENRESVRFLAGGAACAPDSQGPVAAFLFSAQDFFQDEFLEELKLRADSKKTGLVDRKIFQQRDEFLLSFAASEQPVIRIERVHLAGFQAALQAVAQEMGAPLVEIHATFLIYECLQELEFGLSQRDWSCECGHSSSLCRGFRANETIQRVRAFAPTGSRAAISAASSNRPSSPRWRMRFKSSKITRRPRI